MGSSTEDFHWVYTHAQEKERKRKRNSWHKLYLNRGNLETINIDYEQLKRKNTKPIKLVLLYKMNYNHSLSSEMLPLIYIVVKWNYPGGFEMGYI